MVRYYAPSKNLCRINLANFALDTGFVNIDGHLALNIPSNERMFIHKLRCAWLMTEGYSYVYGNCTRYNYKPQWNWSSLESNWLLERTSELRSRRINSKNMVC